MRGPTPRWYFAPGHSWTSTDATIVWVEITDHVMTPMGAGSSRGRSSELDDMRAGTGSFVLDNSDRRFDPTYTAGPYWQTYLNLTGASGSNASTPDHAGLDITGDLDLRVRCSIDDLTPAAAMTLLGKWNATGNQRSYRLEVFTDGTLRLGFSTDGTAISNRASTVTIASVGITEGQSIWLRGTLDVDNGAAGHDAKLWYSLDDTRDHTLVTWTQLGATVTTAGTTSVFSSTALGEVGSNTGGTAGMFTGDVYAAAVLSGIAGTVVADPVFSYGLNAGDTSVTDSTGKVWTVNSPATIESVGSYLKPGVPVKHTGTANGTEYPVYRGFIGGWPQDYDLSNKLATVNVGCTDGMAKLATAGTAASVLELEIIADSPDAYWLMDETAGLKARDKSGNGRDLTFAENVGSWASTVSSPSGVTQVPAIEVRTAEQWALSTDGTIGTTLIEAMEVVAYYAEGELVSGSVDPPFAQLVARRRVTNTQVAGILMNPSFMGASEGTSSYYSSAAAATTTRVGHHYAYRAPGGTTANLRHYFDGTVATPSAGGASLTDAGFIDIGSSSSLVVGKEYTSDIDPVSFVAAHVALWFTTPSEARMQAHAAAWVAPWDDDTTGERIDRILALGWPSDLIDTATGFTILGPASLGKNQLQLIKGYEKAEQGRFFISRAGKATFLDRYYNQLVTAGNTSQATFSDDGSDNAYCSIAFDYDDRVVYNRVRASRAGGAEIEVYDQTSIDTYGEQVDSSLTSLDLGTDAEVRGLAELRLDKYKNPQLRVRPIELKLHGLTAAQQADILDLELGYRVTVERTPQAVGSAITQETVVEGISHRIAAGQWTTTLTLSPVDTAVYGLWGDNWGEALWGY